VKALLLAAGYATRLRPLTDSVPKPLLPIGGRPMLDWLVDKLRAVEEVDGVHVVTNHRYAPDFERWAAANGVVVHDDGTTSNYDLQGLVAFWRGKGVASAVAVHDVGDRELAKRYGVVAVEGDRIVDFVEKPEDPPSTLAATATYLYHRAHVPLVETYLAEGLPPDQPGNLVAWLHRREPVYAYAFPGGWFDVGDREQLLAADNRMRERAGLPARDAYVLDA
jgi:glucose-1-phosphate thymidylyltransferase